MHACMYVRVCMYIPVDAFHTFSFISVSLLDV